MVTKAIRSAQTQVEQQNFEIRKNVLKYDEVLNKQRTVIYDERRRVLAGENIQDQIRAHARGRRSTAYVDGATVRGLRRGLGPGQALDARWARCTRSASAGRSSPASDDDGDGRAHQRGPARGRRWPTPQTPTPRREAEIDELIGAQGGMRELERQVLLQVMDRKWREHLYEMDYLKEGIGLRAMAQRDPLIEYQREGFDMFSAMLEGIKEETVGHLFNVPVQVAEAAPPEQAAPPVREDDTTEIPVVPPARGGPERDHDGPAQPVPYEHPAAPAVQRTDRGRRGRPPPGRRRPAAAGRRGGRSPRSNRANGQGGRSNGQAGGNRAERRRQQRTRRR